MYVFNFCSLFWIKNIFCARDQSPLVLYWLACKNNLMSSSAAFNCLSWNLISNVYSFYLHTLVKSFISSFILRIFGRNKASILTFSGCDFLALNVTARPFYLLTLDKWKNICVAYRFWPTVCLNLDFFGPDGN